MKKLLISFLFILIFINAFSQSSRYEELKNYVSDLGYKISTEQYASIRQGDIAFYNKIFCAGYQYIIVAVSDDGDVRDLDVYLYDEYGKAYTKDDDDSNEAIIDIVPDDTREFKIVMRNYLSYTPEYASVCRFFIAYRK